MIFMTYITMFCLLTNGSTWFNHDQKIDNLDFDLRLIQLQESRIGALEGAQQIPRGFQLLLFQLNIWGVHWVFHVFSFFSSQNSDLTKE